MGELLNLLSQAVENAWPVALGASFLWGVLSVLLSPCHLASIPLIVAFIGGQGRTSARRALGLSCLFAAGILLTIAAIGAITATAGKLLGAVGAWANYFVAAVLFLVGLHLLGVLPLPFAKPAGMTFQRKGMLAALVLGLVFGLALGPCTFTYMAPMLAVAFRLGATRWAYAGLLLLAYGLGHCSVIVAAGTSTELVQRYLHWNEKSRGSAILRRICGVLILLGGLYMIYAAP